MLDTLWGQRIERARNAADRPAVPAQPLPAHVRGLRAVLAVPAVIDHQHPTAMRRGRRVTHQQLQPTGVDPFRIPPGLRQEELQPLHHRVLRPGHRLGPGQRGQRLVAVPLGQQPGQVLPEPRRCANRPNRSSNRAAYPSSGPGAAGRGRRRVIMHPWGNSRTTLPHTADLFQSQQTTASGGGRESNPQRSPAKGGAIRRVPTPCQHEEAAMTAVTRQQSRDCHVSIAEGRAARC